MHPQSLSNSELAAEMRDIETTLDGMPHPPTGLVSYQHRQALMDRYVVLRAEVRRRTDLALQPWAIQAAQLHGAAA